MHELSIASAIVEIAHRHAAGRQVLKVQVMIGHLRQVVPGALRFSFELVAQGTSVEGATLEIEEVPAVVSCRGCEAESKQALFPFQCPACGSMDLQVVAGDELLVESLELQDLELSELEGTKNA